MLYESFFFFLSFKKFLNLTLQVLCVYYGILKTTEAGAGSGDKETLPVNFHTFIMFRTFHYRNSFK